MQMNWKMGVLGLALFLVLSGQSIFAQEVDLTGTWVGKLSVAGGSLALVMHFKKQGDGWTGTVDSPDQGAKGIPISSISLEGRNLEVKVDSVMGTYKATVSEDNKTLTGKWSQNNVSLDLVLTKGAKVSAPKRTQVPKPPFPYKAIEVKINNPKAKGVTLAGTLTVPNGKGPFPAVVLVSGSGPQNRDEELMGHKPFLVLADYLSRRGIAVLRYDDRGTHDSKGDFMTATTLDFASDSLAAVAFLKKRKEINPRKIGIVGHSEGGLVAPIAASQSNDVGFIVLMAGTGVTGEEILYLQSSLLARAGGASEEDIKLNRELQGAIFKIIREEKNDQRAAEKIIAAMDQFLAKQSEEKKAEIKDTVAALRIQARAMVNPWFRTFLTLDPAPYLKKTRVPVLAINGEKDLQVDADQNLPKIEAALKAGGNKRYTIKRMPNLNHLFQKSVTGSPMEYQSIEETINPAALKAIGDWIVKVVGPPAK